MGPLGQKVRPTDDNEREWWWFPASPVGLRRSLTVVEENGRTTLLSETGQPHPGEVWDRLSEDIRCAVGDIRALVVSGSLSPQTPGTLIAEMVSLAHRYVVPSVVDAKLQTLKEAARSGATWAKCHVDELAESFPGTVDDGISGLGRLGATNVVVTAGAEGIIAATDLGPEAESGSEGSGTDGVAPSLMRARTPGTLQGNTTGAGDAVTAGLVRGPAADEPESLGATLRRAVGYGAAVVLVPCVGQLHSSHQELVAQAHVRRDTTWNAVSTWASRPHYFRSTGR